MSTQLYIPKRIKVGDRFGDLTVVEYSHKARYHYWHVTSDCGCTKIKRSDLIRKHEKCGCTRPNKRGVGAPRYVDWTGRRTGRWTVMGRDLTKEGGVFWFCQCDCGTVVTKETGRLDGSSQSCGCYKAEGKNRLRGPNHPNWNADREAAERARDRCRTSDYRHWRNAVVERDGHCCQLSGVKEGGRFALCAHHIESWDHAPELRYEVSNGVTLSWALHVIFHRMFGQGKNTRAQYDQFVRWMELVEIHKNAAFI